MMTPPQIVVRYFTEGATETWTRLVRVLEHSVHAHCPSWTLDVAELPPSAAYSPMGRQGDVANTRKLDAWADAVSAAAEGDRVLLLDADTLIRRPLDDVWSLPFDLAYTTKGKDSRYPFNGGVIFLRVSPATRAFVERWRDVNRFFLSPEGSKEHQVWLPPFGGINQSALGMLFTQPDHAWPEQFRGYRHELDVLRLPCLEWNCEDEHWDAFDPDVTRIVHVKSGLQKATLSREAVGRQFSTLVSEWRAQEEAMQRETRTRAIPRAERNTQITSDDLTNREGVPAPEPEAVGVAVAEDETPDVRPRTRPPRRRWQPKGGV